MDVDEDDGFQEYSKLIGFLCIDEYDIDEMFDFELKEDIKPFDFLYQNYIYGDQEIKNNIEKAFELVFKEKIFITEEGFALGDMFSKRIIKGNNFTKIINLIKEQNCIKKDKTRIKPKNEAQRNYFKRLKKVKAMRQMHEGVEQKDEIADIISSVSAKHSSYNLFNIGRLTIYQLIEQYKRLCSIEEYHINFQSLMHGASSENIKIKHWSEPIE